MKKAIGILAIAALGGVIALILFSLLKGESTKTIYVKQDSVPAQKAYYAPSLEAMGMDFTMAAERTVNAVVHIRTEYERKSSLYDYFFDLHEFFDTPPQGRSNLIVATGSGVIISPKGYIVTNNHVVTEANAISVTLNDKRAYPAKLIGTDPTTDLALLKIDEDDLPFVQYGNSDEVKVGEWALAVGNPFNLTSTVTAGIVSAKARNINILANPEGTSIESFIQTDAAVNKGNSGGALVNVAGELIGINAAIASRTGYYTGYSFAIPVNIVQKVVADLMEFGAVQRGFIGVSIRDVDASLANEESLSDIQGVYVAGIVEDGAADQAGMRQGDVILEVEGFAVNHSSELLERIGQHRPGDKLKLRVRREDKEMLLEVMLRNQENTITAVQPAAIEISGILGAEMEPVPLAIKRRLGLKGGVMVTRVGDGKFREAGIKDQYIILYIDNKMVNSVEDVGAILKNNKRGVLLEGIYPDGTRAYYGFGLKR